ncbi:MAG TPA: hypothetical protein VLJ62_05350 [Burkholderiaceae bacterium]|nr:hypothetical protein [Burkholderiaceae bacterium]
MSDLNVSQFVARVAVSGTLINPKLSALFRLPAVVHWNRLEGRPRSDDLTRSVRAEVRDPLWMLSRQWQFGELDGDDAGTPIRAKLAAQVAQIGALALRNGPPRPYDGKQPLEPLVERTSVHPDLMMALHIGQRWRTMLLQQFGAMSALGDAFVGQFGVAAPNAGTRDLGALRLATHRRELALRLAAGGKAIDGAAVLAAALGARTAGQAPSDAFAAHGVPVAGDEPALDGLADALIAMFGERFVSQPAPADIEAWVPDRLEHDLSLTVPDGAQRATTLIAHEYTGGHLDWYAFDASRPESAPADADLEQRVASFVPTPARFAGAPAPRFWEFEDSHVGFGLTAASKTDIVKLLLANFALATSNDWFIVPLRLRTGSLVNLRGIVVTDNFGSNTLVEPTATRHSALALAGQWGLWTLSRGDAPGQIDPRLFLAPGLAATQEAPPIDEVVFLRDEVANVVWAVESTIPDPLGGGRDARTAARQLREQIRLAYPVPPEVPNVPAEVLLHYQLMGTVPENWIPLVAVRLAGQVTASAFLQGAMPRVPALEPALDGDGNAILGHQVVLPRGGVLERSPVEQPNLIREEELLRGGAMVTRSYQQTRWTDGTTITWLGRRKLNGRGEASSGLAFDQALQRRV